MSSVTAPEGYALVKVLRDSARSRVLLAVRESDGREVVLKGYHGDRNRTGAARHVQREFDAIRSVAGAGVPEALDLLLGESPPLLVLERVPGIALSQWIQQGVPELDAFLTVALRLLETLARVHARRLIHRDMTPDNVLVEPATLELLDALDARPLSRMDKAHSAVLRSRTLALVKRPDEVVRYALGVLRSFGIHWPLHPTRLRAHLALRFVDLSLRLLGTRKLVQPAARRDPAWLAPLLLLGVAGSVFPRHDINLAVLANSLPLRRYLRSGYLTGPGFRIAAHAAYRFVLLGDAEHARRHASLALEWSERIGNPIYAARTAHIVHALLQPWIMRRRQALAPMERVAESAREIGDPEFTYYARFLQTIYLTLAGEAVSVSERRLRELADSVKRAGHWFPEPEQCHHVYQKLVAAPEPRDLDAAVAESYARISAQAGTALHYTSTLWLMILCIYRRHDLAFAQSETHLRDVFRVMPFVHTADFMLYRGLAAAALATHGRSAHRRHHLRALRQCLSRMRGWAKAGPDFVHMAALLEAEAARVRGADERARSLYEQAAQRALAQEFTHHAALAYESRAHMLLDRRRETEAAASLAQASNLYRDWGALPKAAALRERRDKLTGT